MNIETNASYSEQTENADTSESNRLRLTPRILISMFCGITVFCLVNVAAWYNLRGEMNVCRRQLLTRLALGNIAYHIERHRDQMGILPEDLSSLPEIPELQRVDPWGSPIQYVVDESSFELYSFGRDRSPGGEGLDSDLFYNRKSRKESLPTFMQFFTETDQMEVANAEFIATAFGTGLLVAVWSFTRAFNKPNVQHKLISSISSILGIMIVTLLIGLILLPLHIPNGH